MCASPAPASSSPVFTPVRLGPLTLRNRVVKCGTNEGLSREGLVTEPLIAWHREMAAGGVAMTTLAYCSVSADGRTFPHQVWMREEALPGLVAFTEAIHAEGALAAIQIGHAGWFASPRAIRARPVGPSRTFSPHAGTFSREASEEDLARLTRDFAEAARLAARAGFDGIEVHLGHGYLLSQFLTPWNNRRDDAWGGSLEARARFPRQVLRAVREAAPGLAIWPKLNMTDGFRGGLTVDDALQVARWIEEDRSADALQLTGGHTTRTPFFLMRGDVPRREMIADQPHWLTRLGMRLVGPFLLRAWPFEEAFFLPLARRFREAVDLPLMLLGGVNRLDTMEKALAEGFAAVAMGRALIRDPDLVERMRAGELDASRCIHCNRCVVEMDRGGTRCPLRETPTPF
jgi:2,4-dienoyl-CoA reductase-like NADH-dependent reductase (Old Yellow Enzyme family)